MTRSTSSRWALADGLVAVTRFGDHFHVGLVVDQQPQAFSHRRVILDQYNAERTFTGDLLAS